MPGMLGGELRQQQGQIGQAALRRWQKIPDSVFRSDGQDLGAFQRGS